jgi:hypothetical protein
VAPGVGTALSASCHVGIACALVARAHHGGVRVLRFAVVVVAGKAVGTIIRSRSDV